jgi:hypothetical protein
MAVRRHNEALALDDDAFEAWRQQKTKQLVGSTTARSRHGRRRHAQEVMRRYVKRRRAQSEEPSES